MSSLLLRLPKVEEEEKKESDGPVPPSKKRCKGKYDQGSVGNIADE